jgi:hypothetical protein
MVLFIILIMETDNFLLYPEDGSRSGLQNVDWLSQYHTVLLSVNYNWRLEAKVCMFLLTQLVPYCSVEGAEQKQTACYDIDVEVDDTLKTQMNNFLLSTASQQEIQVSSASL